jgi:ribosomal protein S18 acetylase RimI-like enzyme
MPGWMRDRSARLFMFSKIRSIEVSDLKSVITCLREFAELENLSEYLEIDENTLYSAIFADEAIVKAFVALADDKVVGYVLAYPSFSSFKGQMSYHIEDLYVSDGFRAQGIGEAMLREVARLAAANGWSRLDLLVQQQNAGAIRFYKRLGAQVNQDDRHFKFAGEAFDNLLKAGHV